MEKFLFQAENNELSYLLTVISKAEILYFVFIFACIVLLYTANIQTELAMFRWKTTGYRYSYTRNPMQPLCEKIILQLKRLDILVGSCTSRLQVVVPSRLTSICTSC